MYSHNFLTLLLASGVWAIPTPQSLRTGPASNMVPPAQDQEFAVTFSIYHYDTKYVADIHLQ
jgi:hypothetical protein